MNQYIFGNGVYVCIEVDFVVDCDGKKLNFFAELYFLSAHFDWAYGPFSVPCKHDYFGFGSIDVETFWVAPALDGFDCSLSYLSDDVQVITFG